jgi:hypothetical protein
MANRSDDARSVHHIALIGLLAGVALFYGWALAPVEHQAQVWNAAGSISRLALVLAFVGPISNRFLLGVVLLYAGEDAQVFACSIAYIVQPWQIQPGQAQCSALLQTDMGAYGLAAVSVLLLAYPVRPCSVRHG